MNVKGKITIGGKTDAVKLANLLSSLGSHWLVAINGDSIELSCNYTVLN